MKRIKTTVLRLLKSTGAFAGIAESRWRRGRLLILCYHGISLEDEHECSPDTYMTASVFESRLKMLQEKGYTVLPFEEALNRLSPHTLPPKSVAITFDDGMFNFYKHALPLLQQYGCPATMYLTTYYCGSPFPVFPLISIYMLWKKRGTLLKSNPALGLTGPLDLSTSEGRQAAWKQISAHANKNNLSAHDKNELARALAAYLNLDFNELVSKRMFHLMTPEQIQILHKQGVDIQLHTHRHRTPMDQLLFEREITDNRKKIKDVTGVEASHFCYPSGVHQPQFLPWLAEQKVVSATTCEHGLAEATTNPLLLPRFLDTSNVTPIEFESWIAGVSAWLPRHLLRRR